MGEFKDYIIFARGISMGIATALVMNEVWVP
jgi:hypothetical protein